MIVVDTSVWIDLFRGKGSPQVRALEDALVAGEDLCICGVILTEVLQGIRDDADYRKTLSRFEALLFLPMSRHTFIEAAELYRRLRRQGITIRNAVDCMIAAVAMEHDVPLLHQDRDFHPIAKHCGLKIVKPSMSPTKAAAGRASRPGKS